METKMGRLILVALIALILATGNTKAANTELKVASSLKIEKEAGLIVENWMINSWYWDSSLMIDYPAESEKPLELERWMSDNKVWETAGIATETEKKLEIEDWMHNANYWDFD